MKISYNKKYRGKSSVKASNEGRSDLTSFITRNGDPVAKGSYDAMVKKSYTYNYPVQMLKFPKAKLNSLMKMAKDAHRPDPLKFAVNRFINDYTDEYDSLNASCNKKSVKAASDPRTWAYNIPIKRDRGDYWEYIYTVKPNKLYLDCPGAYYISSGNNVENAWIEYNGYLYNEADLTDILWSWYNEICDEEGVPASDDGFEAWVTPNEVENTLYDLAPFAKVVYGKGENHTARGVEPTEVMDLSMDVDASCRGKRSVKASTSGKIPYDLVSMLVILRDWVDTGNAYVNEEHNALVDIADGMYNAGLSIDEMRPEYKATYDKYGQKFFDMVLNDASAIDSQISSSNVNDLIADYEDRANAFESGIQGACSSKRSVKASTDGAVDGYAVEIRDMHDALHDLLLFNNRADADWAEEQLDIICDRAERSEIDDYEYRDMISYVLESSDDWVEEIDFRKEIDTNNIWTALDDSKWQIINNVAIDLWL